jgi:segregation and condensation protein A
LNIEGSRKRRRRWRNGSYPYADGEEEETAKGISCIGEEAGEGTEIQTINHVQTDEAFERVMQKYSDGEAGRVHTVVQYNYTMEESRDNMLSLARQQKTVSFEKIFSECENRVHAIFLFLSLLELVQLKFLKIMIGEGRIIS